MLSGALPALTVLVLTAVGVVLAAAMPLAPAARLAAASTGIAAPGAVALVSPTAAVSRPEAVVAVAGRLTDREICRRSCGRGRAFQAGQRRANQRSVNRSFIVSRLARLFGRSGHGWLCGIPLGERVVIDGCKRSGRRRFRRGDRGDGHSRLAKLRSASG
jgi:hypothetical protein